MESGMRAAAAEEAGPSNPTTTTSSVGCSEKQLEEQHNNEMSDAATHEEEEEEEEVEDGANNINVIIPPTVSTAEFVPGPLLSLKQQLQKDKDDESLRKWKEKLLGSIANHDFNDEKEAEVKFHSIGIVGSDFEEITTPLPINDGDGGGGGRRVLFTLREGSEYQLRLTFTVLHNIVSGLTYTNTVWKSGIQVDQKKGMLGTFAPQREPYVHTMEEETTPSGLLARGLYSAKLKFEDDDKRCHMELKYCFQIKKAL